MDYSYAVKPNAIPQTEPASPAQAENNAGGFSFVVDVWTRVRRFLILGAEGGTFYVGERKLILENAKAIQEALKLDPAKLVGIIVEVSDKALAPKNDPAIFALALAASSDDLVVRKLAYEAFPKVCRTSTHLFHFLTSVQGLRGWSKGLRKAVTAWYMRQRPDQLENQVIKYRQRDGWTHRDVLRLAHIKPWSTHAQDVFQYVVARDAGKPLPKSLENLPIIQNFETAQSFAGETPAVLTAFLKVIEGKLPWEALPTEFLKSADVWRQLLPTLGLTALVRNLGKLSSIGVLPAVGAGLNEDVQFVASRLTNVENIKKSRMHPMDFLLASKIYGQGHGQKGTLTWPVSAPIVDALEKAFYLAFQNVEPTGKRFLVALDVSGSMGNNMTTGQPISCREAGAALTTVIKRTEPWTEVMGFGNTFFPLNVGATETVRELCRRVNGLPFQRTDCSLPMEYAIENKLNVDVFVVITDNETFAGKRHPHVALQDYRKRFNPNAKLVVMGMAANEFTIAEPTDAGMIDVAGLDSSFPSILSAFVRGYR